MASELEVTKRQFYSEYNLLNESDGNMFIEVVNLIFTI